MTLLQKMDRLVYATGIDRIIFMKFQPRSFRWSPLLVIAVLVVGYVLMARTSSQPDRSFLIGSMLFYGAFMVAVFLRLLGPVGVCWYRWGIEVIALGRYPVLRLGGLW